MYQGFVRETAARLDDRFQLLTSGTRTALPRRRTLHAVIDWSYSLLSEKERSLPSCLSVFVGGWTLEATEAVSSDDIASDGLFGLMAHLVNRSLVEVADEPGGGARYRMLETVRLYGLERLSETEQLEAARRHHALFFAGLAERAEPQLRGPAMRTWLERLEVEHGKFRVALERTLTHGSPDSGLCLAGALGILWRKRGYLSEGRTWLDERGRRLVEQGVAICRHAGDRRQLAWATAALSLLLRWQGRIGEALRVAKESLRLAVEVCERTTAVFSMTILAGLAEAQGETE